MRRALAAALLLAATAPAAAASFALGERERAEALRVGQRSITGEGFDAEWRVTNGAGESVTVLTPFHRLALAARHAAFKREPVRPTDVRKLLREQQDRLLFLVSLRGRREDFARGYEPRLLTGDRELEAAFVQNEHSALREEGGSYLARCVYGFSTKYLSGTARVQLVVRAPDGQDVSRFTIDLGRMR